MREQDIDGLGIVGNNIYATAAIGDDRISVRPWTIADADDCGDNRCDIVTEVFQKVQNIGESYAPLNRYIPYPGSSKTTPPSGSYDMWSYQPFGTSTAYRQHLETPLDWCPNTWCF